MIKNKLFSIISLFAIALFVAKPVYAVSLPNFGTCLNPQGKQIASYDSGSHGIVGQSQEASGSDAVYQSSTNGVTQCMCPDNGNGVQTNWLKADNLSDNDISILKNQGWVYIATGSNRGLEDIPYLAKNSNYACRKNATTSNTGKVLGLASTGDSVTIYTFVLSGAAFLIAGMVLRKFSR